MNPKIDSQERTIFNSVGKFVLRTNGGIKFRGRVGGRGQRGVYDVFGWCDLVCVD